ncbi:MAG TPA: hypothetical protein IAC82_07950 [Candidatus Merdivicinus intestinigallinarum]|nr:hypothetical protein [Candidatus Merdivicinus intestinigallinarum]
MMIKRKKILLAAVSAAAVLVLVFLAWNPAKQLYRQLNHLPDENGMYAVQGQWFEAMPDLDEDSVLSFANRLNAYIIQSLTSENTVYYGVIPDKSWYSAESGWPTLDHSRLAEILRENIQGAAEIDLTPALSLEDYYQTDRHWRQERLQSVLDTLGDAMGFSVKLSDFTENTITPFHGSFEKKLKNPPEEPFVYLTGGALDSVSISSYQYPELQEVYDLSKLESENTYDVFLGGISPIVTLTNPNAESQRELVIFGDSYSSSLAPLLCGEYRTVTIVDLRFIFSSLLPDLLNFTNQDVLFLYSDWILNNSAMLRF